MTKSVIQPMESYRLAQYVVPTRCFICEADNTFDSEFCSNCFAPMGLAHQVKNENIRPQMVAVIGASGAGKTVYLGMLMDMLSRQPQRLQLVARGAFSITLQQTTMSALARCQFPNKTPNEPDRWNWVHCQMRFPKRRETMELIIPDMAGEAVLEEVDHAHSYRVVRSFLKRCTAAMILVDAIKIKEGSREQDFFTLKLLTYLRELNDDVHHGWSQRPVAVVFAKADQCEDCMEDPAAYAKSQAAGLWQCCHESFRRHQFFASGVAGTCAWRESMSEGRVQVPLRIEPHGIVEPFQWLLEQLNVKKGKN
jgi:GTPase SAR1 family protein